MLYLFKVRCLMCYSPTVSKDLLQISVHYVRVIA